MSNSSSNIRWGIIGLGNIAHQFAKDLIQVPGCELVGVASRTEAKAQVFADTYRVPKAFGSYEAMIADPEIDMVYIATPHDSHLHWSITAMHAGKHVLCEKPVAVNSTQLREMIRVSNRYEVFFMEALWTRFNPVILKALSHIADGQIGAVNYIQADFSFFIESPRLQRLTHPERAGGSLLEMGIYPVFLAYLIMGIPLQIQAHAHLTEVGTDLQTSAIFQYESGIANLMSGFLSQSDMRAKIYGTEGSIIFDPYWHETNGLTLTRGSQRQRFTTDLRGKGFTYEIEECIRCIQAGKTQSAIWSHQNSLDLMGLLDQIRSLAGIHYPFESTSNSSIPHETI